MCKEHEEISRNMFSIIDVIPNVKNSILLTERSPATGGVITVIF